MLRLAPWLVYRISKLTDGPRPRSQRPPQAQNVVGAGFSHAAAGALAGFIGFQNWRMTPCPDPRGLPRPKMYLELALAMLRLAPWLALSGFKTDGCDPKGFPRPKLSLDPGFSHAAAGALAGFIGFQNWRMAPGPDPKGPKCSWSWLLPCCGWRPGWFYRVSKLTDGPRSRSQRRSELALAMLATFIRFQNWRMAPTPIPKASPGPKCLWSWL